MRQFLYYNQDSVNSIIAQIEQGLLIKRAIDETQEQTTSYTQETQSDITGDLSAKVLGIGASVQGNIKETDSDTEIATQLVRSIQEKALHDYAFDRVFEYMTINGLINNNNPQIGDIILANDRPTFLDFNYFLSLFADNGTMKFANEQAKKKMEEQLAEIRKSIPNGKSMPELIKVQIKEAENQVKNADSDRKEFAKTIEVIKNTLPYNRFVMTNHYLVPLADKYLRDDPDIIAFKYGGTMSILGHITNIIDDKEPKLHTNAFVPLYDTVNKVMLNLFQNKDKIFIIHPIAIYY